MFSWIYPLHVAAGSRNKNQMEIFKLLLFMYKIRNQKILIDVHHYFTLHDVDLLRYANFLLGN